MSIKIPNIFAHVLPSVESLLQENKFVEALSIIRSLRGTAPTNIALIDLELRALGSTRDTPRRLSLASRSLKAHPESESVFTHYIESLVDLGFYSRAVKLAEGTRFPFSLARSFALLRAYSALKRSDRGIQIAQRILEKKCALSADGCITIARTIMQADPGVKFESLQNLLLASLAGDKVLLLNLIHAEYLWRVESSPGPALDKYIHLLRTMPSPPHAAVAGLIELLRTAGEDAAVQSLQASIEKTSLPKLPRRRSPWKINSVSGEKTSEKSVVFFTDLLRGRQMKLALALKALGWRVTFCAEERLFSGAPAILSGIPIILYRSAKEAQTKLLEIEHSVKVVCNSFGDSNSLAILSNSKTPTVFDPYDIIDGMIFREGLEEARIIQDQCILAADALICRDLRLPHLQRMMDLSALDKPRILVPDYGWGSLKNAPVHSDTRIAQARAGELHAVSAGFIGDGSSEDDWGLLEFSENLLGNGIHVHIYPHALQNDPGSLERMQKIVAQKDRSRGLLHLEAFVSADELINQLSRYHIGIAVYFPHALSGSTSNYSEAHFRTMGSSRITDYLEAGLVTVVDSTAIYQKRYASRFGTVACLTKENSSTLPAEIRKLATASSYTTKREIGILSHIANFSKFLEDLEMCN